MAADYDLVILGSSTTAELLALEANARNARVAWITFPQIVSDWHIRQLYHPNPDWLWQLVSRGIDVIEAEAQLVAPSTVQVEKRTLTGRHFAVCNPAPLNLRQLVQGWTWQEFYACHHTLTELTIVGGSNLCLAVAQWLNQRGIAVSLLLPTTTLLPQVDREANRFLQAQLEGQGIKIFTGHRVTATRKSADGETMEVWAGDRHFVVRHLLLPQFPAILPQLQLHFVPTGRLHLVRHRTDVPAILRAVLFWYREASTPLAITCAQTCPAIAQVSGFRYGSGKTLVLRSVSPQHFAKIITTPRGEIISASMVGTSAVFWIEAIAQAMRSQKSIHSLPTHDPISAELVAQFLSQERHPLRELWLNVCRDFHL